MRGSRLRSARAIAGTFLARTCVRWSFRLAAALYEPFERARRVVVPTHRVWKDAGAVLATLWNRLPAVRSRVTRGLVNDALIALTARSIGAAVVTRNEKDFRLVREVRTFNLEIV